MSEQPISRQEQEQQLAISENTPSEQEQEQQLAANENTPSEDFEAGVLAQLDSLYRTARRMTSSQQEAEDFYLYNLIKDLTGQELNIGAEEEVLSHYLDEDVYNALNELPPNFRMAVILADIEGLSYKEIAEALNIPIGTVMSRISRARRQLQRSLWQYAKDRGYVKAQAS